MKTTAILALMTSAILLFACRQESKEAKEPPRFNVLYISLEDIGPFLGCYNWPQVSSPRIDAFAQRAVLFEDVHCQVSLCTPSRTSILTGVRPTTSSIVKIDDQWQDLLPDVTSMPRHFRDNGYYTHAVGKIYDSRCGGMDEAFTVDETHRMLNNDRALAALEASSAQDKPFFLAIGYFQVHTPWEPTDWGRSLYHPDSLRTEGMSPDFRGENQSPQDLRGLIRDYYAFISDVDSLVGDLLDRAEQLHMLENTIVLLGAMDHGFSLGWRGKWGKGNNYDMETMVPLMVRVPGNPNNGQRATGLVELVDIYPTLVDYCRLPQPQHALEGYSLRGLLQNPASSWKKAVFTTRAYHPRDFGVKTKAYTLVAREEEGIKLFDRNEDPFNLRDISAEHPGIVEELLVMNAAGWRAALPQEMLP